MSPEISAELVADFEFGVPSSPLTVIYGLGKGSVLKLLQEAGIQTCNQGLHGDNLEEAAALYKGGWS